MRVLGRCALTVCVICAVHWGLRTGTLLAFSDERGREPVRRNLTFAEALHINSTLSTSIGSIGFGPRITRDPSLL